MGTEASSGWSDLPSYFSSSSRSAPDDMASTRSLMVTPSFLLVSLTSASAKVAVAKRRWGVSTWFMKLAGGVNGRVSSGDSLRVLLRTRAMPSAVYLTTPGMRPICRR